MRIGGVFKARDAWLVYPAESAVLQLLYDLSDDPAQQYERLATDAEAPAHHRQWAQSQRDRLARRQLPDHYDVRLHTVYFGDDGPVLLPFSDELCSGHAVAIKREMANWPVAVLGYTHGLDIYIPTDRKLRGGGYEAVDSVQSTREMPAPFATGVDERLLAAATAQIGHMLRQG